MSGEQPGGTSVGDRGSGERAPALWGLVLRGWLVLLLIAVLGWVGQCYVPLIAGRARRKIRPGMTAEEVVAVLESYNSGLRLFCRLGPRMAGNGFGTGRECIQVIEERVAAGADFTATLTPLWMGPATLHNDFDIPLDRHGKVVSVGRVRHWD